MNAMDMQMSAGGENMNAIDLLTTDHRKVDELFARLEGFKGAEDGSEGKRLFLQLKENLNLHALVEEQIFYPALKGHKETQELVPEAYHEHQDVKELLARMTGLTPNQDNFQTMLAELKSNVHHHVGEEESEMFAKARNILGEEKLSDLGRQIQQMKEREKPNTSSMSATM